MEKTRVDLHVCQVRSLPSVPDVLDGAVLVSETSGQWPAETHEGQPKRMAEGLSCMK